MNILKRKTKERERDKEDYKRDVITTHCFAINHAVPGSFLSSNQEIKREIFELFSAWSKLYPTREHSNLNLANYILK